MAIYTAYHIYALSHERKQERINESFEQKKRITIIVFSVPLIIACWLYRQSMMPRDEELREDRVVEMTRMTLVMIIMNGILTFDFIWNGFKHLLQHVVDRFNAYFL